MLYHRQLLKTTTITRMLEFTNGIIGEDLEGLLTQWKENHKDPKIMEIRDKLKEINIKLRISNAKGTYMGPYIWMELVGIGKRMRVAWIPSNERKYFVTDETWTFRRC